MMVLPTGDVVSHTGREAAEEGLAQAWTYEADEGKSVLCRVLEKLAGASTERPVFCDGKVQRGMESLAAEFM